jgi:hypothetical protein
MWEKQGIYDIMNLAENTEDRGKIARRIDTWVDNVKQFKQNPQDAQNLVSPILVQRFDSCGYRTYW